MNKSTLDVLEYDEQIAKCTSWKAFEFTGRETIASAKQFRCPDDEVWIDLR
jgi:hypothetical protein